VDGGDQRLQKFIIGGIYRHPSSNINKFTEKMDNTLAPTSKQKLPCSIAGDINIDLKKTFTYIWTQKVTYVFQKMLTNIHFTHLSIFHIYF